MKRSTVASLALVMLAAASLASCGTSGPVDASRLGAGIATDAQSACGLARSDQRKIDATNESLIGAGLHKRPSSGIAAMCEQRRRQERRP